MTRVITVNADLYRYEIHSLFKAFYPQDDIKVVVQGDEHAKGILAKNPFLFAWVTYHDDQVILDVLTVASDESAEQGREGEDRPVTAAGSEDSVNGSAGGSAFRHFYTDRPANAQYSYKMKNKALKDALKTLLYDSLSQVTGRQLPWGDLIGIRPTKICTTLLEEGWTQEKTISYLEDQHRVSHEKAQLAADIAQRERRILAPIHYADGFSLYIGIPFCPTTCLYCSFPSFNVALWKDRVDDYLTALIREMQATSALLQEGSRKEASHPADPEGEDTPGFKATDEEIAWKRHAAVEPTQQYGHGKILDTIYIGGGTPTTLEPAQLERLLCAVEDCFDTTHVLEYTVEAGRPDSITRDKLQVMKAHHVTRISVNPQTMNEVTLRVIGRHHTVQQTMDAYYLARDCGFDNINMDIILGLPGEGVPEVSNTIDEIERLRPDDLTVHSLAIKRASRLRRIIDEQGYPALVNTDETMKIAAAGAARMGMKPYYLYRQKNMSGNFENTGYAREGRYGIYNILIMEEKQSILALGAGSISKIVVPDPVHPGMTRIERADHPKDVATYIDNIDEMIARERRLFSPIM